MTWIKLFIPLFLFSVQLEWKATDASTYRIYRTSTPLAPDIRKDVAYVNATSIKFLNKTTARAWVRRIEGTHHIYVTGKYGITESDPSNRVTVSGPEATTGVTLIK